METTIDLGSLALGADLDIPNQASGLVVFAHGSGSNHHSPRNQHVAYLLRARGFATLLFDGMTGDEERRTAMDATPRYDVDLQADRLIAVTDWIGRDPRLSKMALGYFGSSTGAAAAIIAAGERPGEVGAIVCRGGRPDLAGERLAHVRAPTLLVVGSEDAHVLEVNLKVQDRLGAPHRLEIIAGAGHLFAEPGSLDELSRLAGDWFTTWLERTRPITRRSLGDAVC